MATLTAQSDTHLSLSPGAERRFPSRPRLSCGISSTERASIQCMRVRSFSLIFCALWGCRQAPPAPTSSSQGSTRQPPPRANSAPSIPARPTAAALELVVSGKELSLAVVRDETTGVRVRVWNSDLSAHAQGDGPLIADQQPELWVEAPYDPRKQTLTYAGTLPSSFAFRRNDVPCSAVDDSAVLVLQGRKWREHRLRSRALPPHAFLAWNGGALLVDSQIQPCGWATSSPVEQLDQATGTVFTQVAKNGTVSPLSLDLDPAFMAWAGSSAEQTLTLLGTYGVRADAGAPAVGSRDIVVMRRHGQGPFKASLIVHADGPASQSVRTQVREFGAAALVWPPPVRDDGTPVTGALAEGGDEIAWKQHAASIVLIKDDSKAELPFRSAAEQDCHVREATLAGDRVYAIVACPSSPARLVRAGVAVPPEPIAIPALAGLACVPTRILANAPNDLWLRAACGGTSEKPETTAVFRQGHAQQPLRVP